MAHADATGMGAQKKTIQQMLNKEYKWGFKSDIEAEAIPKGLSEDTVRLISAKKNEPEWMLEFRLKAYRRWLTMKEPTWSDNHHPPIDFNNIVYYSEPKVRPPVPTQAVAAYASPHIAHPARLTRRCLTVALRLSADERQAGEPGRGGPGDSGDV